MSVCNAFVRVLGVCTDNNCTDVVCLYIKLLCECCVSVELIVAQAMCLCKNSTLVMMLAHFTLRFSMQATFRSLPPPTNCYVTLFMQLLRRCGFLTLVLRRFMRHGQSRVCWIPPRICLQYLTCPRMATTPRFSTVWASLPCRLTSLTTPRYPFPWLFVWDGISLLRSVVSSLQRGEYSKAVLFMIGCWF